jgi:hypothetical protein
MDLLAGIRVPGDFVSEVQPAGMVAGIGFDGEQQASEFVGVFLHRLTRPLSDLFDILEKAHDLSPSSRPACEALVPRGMPDTL